jgi:hypothetical protein
MHSFKRLRWLPVIEKGRHLSRSFVHYSKSKESALKVMRPLNRISMVNIPGKDWR